MQKFSLGKAAVCTERVYHRYPVQDQPSTASDLTRHKPPGCRYRPCWGSLERHWPAKLGKGVLTWSVSSDLRIREMAGGVGGWQGGGGVVSKLGSRTCLT